MALRTSDVQFCGYIGVVIYAIFLVRAVCRGIIDHTEKPSTKHNSLQLLLFFFVLFKLSYYATLAVEGEDLPIPYAFRILANFLLALAFIIFTGMWAEVMTASRRFRSGYDVLLRLLALAYSTITIGLTTVILYSGEARMLTIIDDLAYQLYAVSFPVICIVASGGFLAKAICLYSGNNIAWEGRERQLILKKLSLILLACAVSGVTLLTVETLLFIQGSSNDIREQMPLAVFFLFDQWLPNVALLVLMLQFTNRDEKLSSGSRISGLSQSYHGDRVRFDEAKNAIISDNTDWSSTSITPSSSERLATSTNTSFYDLAQRAPEIEVATEGDSRLSRDSLKQIV